MIEKERLGRIADRLSRAELLALTEEGEDEELEEGIVEVEIGAGRSDESRLEELVIVVVMEAGEEIGVDEMTAAGSTRDGGKLKEGNLAVCFRSADFRGRLAVDEDDVGGSLEGIEGFWVTERMEAVEASGSTRREDDEIEVGMLGGCTFDRSRAEEDVRPSISNGHPIMLPYMRWKQKEGRRPTQRLCRLPEPQPLSTLPLPLTDNPFIVFLLGPLKHS